MPRYVFGHLIVHTFIITVRSGIFVTLMLIGPSTGFTNNLETPHWVKNPQLNPFLSKGGHVGI